MVSLCFDKYQSKKKGQRISENTLLLLALTLGAVGIFCGMKAPIYHKAGKTKFKILIPFLLLMQFFIFVLFILKFRFTLAICPFLLSNCFRLLFFFNLCVFVFLAKLKTILIWLTTLSVRVRLFEKRFMTDSEEVYLNKALKISEEINYQRGISTTLGSLGIIAMHKRRIPKSIRLIF